MNEEILNWTKVNNLMPVIIQDIHTLRVLMHAYMTPEALDQTTKTKRVTFYSRTKQRLWTKGETTGHYLQVEEIISDCDQDTLLILVTPQGPTCHLNNPSCFKSDTEEGIHFFAQLEQRIAQRFIEKPPNSYTTELFNSGITRIAQKVGEEGVEVALAAVTITENDTKELVNEISDLFYHTLVLAKACSVEVKDIINTLKSRGK